MSRVLRVNWLSSRHRWGRLITMSRPKTQNCRGCTWAPRRTIQPMQFQSSIKPLNKLEESLPWLLLSRLGLVYQTRSVILGTKLFGVRTYLGSRWQTRLRRTMSWLMMRPSWNKSRKILWLSTSISRVTRWTTSSSNLWTRPAITRQLFRCRRVIQHLEFNK